MKQLSKVTIGPTREQLKNLNDLMCSNNIISSEIKNKVEYESLRYRRQVCICKIITLLSQSGTANHTSVSKTLSNEQPKTNTFNLFFPVQDQKEHKY